jgi:hypothetical protein
VEVPGMPFISAATQIIFGAMRSLSAFVWLCRCYALAAKRYEELSRVSEAELHQEGYTRKTLPRDLCKDAEADAATGCRNESF